MNNRSMKRTIDELLSDGHEEQIASASILKKPIQKSKFKHLCTDILLKIFQYLSPPDLLYSFTGIYNYLDDLIKPYTKQLDFRFVNKSLFLCLTKSIYACFTNNLLILHLSNVYTFGQITEALDKLDWSRITQLESLTLGFIEYEELARYFLVIHPLLKNLWRLTITFNENEKLADKLIIDKILLSTNQSESLKSCFIHGITFDLSKLPGLQYNENLREITITLATINDFINLSRLTPRLEVLTCTIIQSTFDENFDRIKSLHYLTMLTLIIQKSILFKTLQRLLMPHSTLEKISLKAILHDEYSSTETSQEINGFILEKLFRTFPKLNKLDFYLRHTYTNDLTTKNCKPDYLYLFPFTSYFWLNRSIEVATHFIRRSRERYVYTLPFAFNSFDIVDNIEEFFSIGYPYYFANVHHLSLSSTTNFDQSLYSNVLLKFFPNIQTITFTGCPSIANTFNILNNNQWIRPKSTSTISSSIMDAPYLYIRNRRKSTRLYVRRLNIDPKELIILANNNQHIRHMTIYEMTQEQSISLKTFFPWLHTLTLYINTLDWCFSTNDWFYYLLTEMPLLFSLTIYYPKYSIDVILRDTLANTLLNVKKHFYIKCHDGILNIWF